ncbi:hypothetical protein V5799_014691 [Amblyomma americanum]|uniref:phenylalanine--tRNA ligase n=1 Tax=Amblyomma americanum TaxID=6943 RepID=A0AAQ4E2A3_AMBAM
MADLAERILQHVAEHGPCDSLQLARVLKVDHQKVVGAIKSIQAFGDVLRVEQQSGEHWELSTEGAEICSQGSPEGRLVRRLGPEGVPRASLGKGDQLGLSKALALNWVKLDKERGTVLPTHPEPPPDTVQASLCQVRDGQAHLLDEGQRQDLKRRKLLRLVVVKSYRLEQGEHFATQLSKPETDLTAELLASGAWRQRPFKAYNFAALGQPTDGGHLHPLLQVRSEVRQIFLEMGFTEMSTSRYVESAFWNFDALFQPQQHPARDAHDTFFLKDPSECQQLPEPEYVEAVRRVHAEGGHGSLGYQGPWLESEARKNLLRTHTTAVSARMLHALAAQQPFKPSKLFSIDRVFRNETLDATHLAEFCQVEGLVADRGLTLGHLQALIGGFFARLGMERVRFKPAYNPYTEPSMEVFAFHPGLSRWVEVGNSGLFRPEMLLPMGLPPDVRCIAWGLSLERPTMIKCGLNNIRDLVGPRVDLDMVYRNPLCRFVR